MSEQFTDAEIDAMRRNNEERGRPPFRFNRIVTPQEAARDMMGTITRVAAEEGVPESAVAVLAAGILGAAVDADTLQWAADEISRAKAMSTDDNTFKRVHWDGDEPLPSDDDDEHGMPLQPRGPGLSAEDLELLTLAARAIGARVEPVEGEQWVALHFDDGQVVHGWNSLRHNGDTFELLVRLELHLDFAMGMVVAYAGTRSEKQCIERRGDDSSAATRLAVTRAAAEIAKQRS